MGNGMPYHFEKGPTWSVIESVANRGPHELLDLLRHLRLGTSLAELAGMDSVTLDHGPNNTLAKRVQHINGDIFGMHVDPQTKQWVKQPPLSKASPSSTGYWTGYFGDVEQIFRTALTRAAEVSLGLDHGADPGVFAPKRFWPIDVSLVCVFNWYEAWVTWRRHDPRPGDPPGAEHGQVTLHLLTPGHGDVVLSSPLAPPQPLGDAYELEPTGCEGGLGQWVVTYEDHQKVDVPPTSTPSGSGNIPLPAVGSVYFGTGNIVTVQPSEAGGGVLPNGRPYVAPR
jgi:hypothetical protein